MINTNTGHKTTAKNALNINFVQKPQTFNKYHSPGKPIEMDKFGKMLKQGTFKDLNTPQYQSYTNLQEEIFDAAKKYNNQDSRSE